MNDLLFKIALTQVPLIGHVHAKILALHFGSAEAIFKARKSDLERIEGIGEVRAKNIKHFNEFKAVQKEIDFLHKYQIRCIYITDPAYPQRLLNCYDPPTLLYFKGTVDLNSQRVIAIVGTRNNSDYGKQMTEDLLRGLSGYGVTIVSGLAYGIDAIAHKFCIKHQIPTVGVLAHGLDTIYPSANKTLAKQMIETGGLLTEFKSGTGPDKHNFPSRNRIVAGISDATVIIETGVKGGSIITGELAFGYNRDVFAVPGRTSDQRSAGCNFLIRTNKAILLSSSEDLADALGWKEPASRVAKKQPSLFADLGKDETIIVELLQQKETVSIDELNFRSGLSSSAIASALLKLELESIVKSLPGKSYMLV